MPFSVIKLMNGIALLNHINTIKTKVIPSQLNKDERKIYD
jgi:hypothetical protein